MLLNDLAILIKSLGYGQYFPGNYHPANNIFLNVLPPKPENVICLYDTGGSGNAIGFPDLRRSVQLFVRDVYFENGDEKIWAIYNSLTDISTQGFISINGRKMLIKSVNTPISIGKDPNGLFEFSCNFNIITKGDY